MNIIHYYINLLNLLIITFVDWICGEFIQNLQLIHLSMVCSISLDLLHFGMSFYTCLELSLEHFQESYGLENINLYCPWSGPRHTKDSKMISDLIPEISQPIFPRHLYCKLLNIC